MTNPIKKAFAVDAAGRATELQDSQVEGAAQAGLKFLTQEHAGQLAKREADARYVDENYGTLGNAALGAASGLSLGLAPAFASRVGLIDKGHLEAAEETGAFMAGDIAGMVAPAVLSGGESLAARGVAQGGLRGAGKIAAALTPAGLMAEAGGLTERLAGHFLSEAGIMGKLATPTIKMAARGATEGAIVNLSHTYADAVIQNKPLAAQSLLAAGVDGALFGGLAGGVLGGASAALGAGVDVVGGRVANLGSGSGEKAAAKALKFMGATDTDLAMLANKEGGLVGAVKGYGDVIQNGEGSIASGAGSIRKSALASEAAYRSVAEEAIGDLTRNHPAGVPQLSRISQRLNMEVADAFAGTLEGRTAAKINLGLQKELRSVRTWEHWAKTREQLADRLASSSGLQQQIYKSALSAVDGELLTAMEAADGELAKKFSAAVTGQRTSAELADMVSKKAATPGKNVLAIDNSDAATMGFSVFTGADPVVGAGILAGKKLVQYAAQKLEPHMAEAAYRSAIGAQAGKATVDIGRRISSSLKTFMTGARVSASAEHAKPKKISYSMSGYQKALDDADALTSVAQQNRVKEITTALMMSGHPDLANEMAATYGRAVAYVNHNKPKSGSKEHAAGSIGRVPKAMSLTTKGMKFLTQFDGVKNPMGIVEKLMNGEAPSRAAIAAVKYVYPDLHQEIVFRASQEILDMKADGKFLPADKVAMLGVVLDAPVDSKLDKTFIDAVQAGHVANNTPQKAQQPSGAPPVTDISQFQTPLQSTV